MKRSSKSPQHTMKQTFNQRFSLPYKPPSHILSYSEAVFSVATTGRNILKEPLSFFADYLSLLGLLDASPHYIDGFPDLSRWLVSTFFREDKNDLKHQEFLDKNWVEAFVADENFFCSQKYVAQLGRSLDEIVMSVTSRWDPKCFVELLKERIDQAICGHTSIVTGINAIEAKENLLVQKNQFTAALKMEKLLEPRFIKYNKDATNEIAMDYIKFANFAPDYHELMCMLLDDYSLLQKIKEYLYSLDTRSYIITTSLEEVYGICAQIKPRKKKSLPHENFSVLTPGAVPGNNQNDCGSNELSSTVKSKQYEKSKLHAHVVAAIVRLAYRQQEKFTNRDVRKEIQKSTSPETYHQNPDISEVSRAKKYLTQTLNVQFITKNSCKPTAEGLKILKTEFDRLKLPSEPNSL